MAHATGNRSTKHSAHSQPAAFGGTSSVVAGGASYQVSDLAGTRTIQFPVRLPEPLTVRMSDDPFSSSPWPPQFTAFRAIVCSVYDGDTCTALVELSDFMYVMKDIRLLGVDCYELRKGRKAWRAKGAAAQAFTAQRLVPGAQIIVRTPKSEVSNLEKYGRLLGRVFYWGADGTEHDLAAELVAAGYQKPPAKAPPAPARKRR